MDCISDRLKLAIELFSNLTESNLNVCGFVFSPLLINLWEFGVRSYIDDERALKNSVVTEDNDMQKVLPFLGRAMEKCLRKKQEQTALAKATKQMLWCLNKNGIQLETLERRS